MRLIIALGNPDKEYLQTRHNFAWISVDNLAKKYSLNWTKNKNSNSLITDFISGREKIILAKPLTYMNNSGVTVAYAVKKHPNLKPEDIIVIHDDKDLPLGEIRVQINRGPAGHKAVSAIDCPDGNAPSGGIGHLCRSDPQGQGRIYRLPTDGRC